MPTRSTCSQPCFRAGISSALLAESSNFQPSYLAIPTKAGFGQHVRNFFFRVHFPTLARLLAHVCSILSGAAFWTMPVWMLGNLARASYVGSSDFMWPYSYNKCDTRNRRSQEINACARVNHYGLASFVGRGAPEIDVLESMQGEKGSLPNTFIERPYQSTSFQVAPGIEIDRPVLGHRPHDVRTCPCHFLLNCERWMLTRESSICEGALVREPGIFFEE